MTEDEEESRAPGGSWLRLAALILAGLLLLVAVVIAYNLGRGKTPLGADRGGAGTPSSSTSPDAGGTTPIEGITASDFDPQGDPPEEYPELAPLAVDGKPATAWKTNTYTDQLGPTGLKTGIGMVLDLHGSHDVSGIDLTLVGSPASVKIYTTDTEPSRVFGLDPVDAFTTSRTTTHRTFDAAVSARYVIIWFTSLPPVDGGYRVGVAEAGVTE